MTVKVVNSQRGSNELYDYGSRQIAPVSFKIDTRAGLFKSSAGLELKKFTDEKNKEEPALDIYTENGILKMSLNYRKISATN